MVKTETLLCIIGILIFLIIILGCFNNKPRFPISKFPTPKQLFHKLSEEELKFRISCLDQNGEPTQPIKTKDGWRCKHYYNTTDIYNSVPTTPTTQDGFTCVFDNSSQSDLFTKCNDNATNANCSPQQQCELGEFNERYQQVVISPYGTSETGTISGFRVDHPFITTSPVFMRIDDIHASSLYTLYNGNPTTATDIDDCEDICAKSNCFSYSYYTDQNGQGQCIANISRTKAIGGNTLSIVKS